METDIKSAVNTKGKEKDRSFPDEEISLLYVEATKFGLQIYIEWKYGWECVAREWSLEILTNIFM